MKKVLITLCSLSLLNLYSQGCSDAGFCSLGSSMPLSNYIEPQSKPNLFRLGFTYGKAEKSLNAYNPFIEYTRFVNKDISFIGRMNFLAHTGNDVQTGEIGDILVAGNFRLSPCLKTSIGFKIPFRNGNKVKKGIVLPMDYQPTLGTFDFLWSLETKLDNFHIGMGWQQPLSQNQNRFFTTDFIATEEFQTTNGFRRGPDAWLRVSYPVQHGSWTFVPNILPIYHVGNDTYIDQFGNKQIIQGSKGLTLNGDIQIDYKMCPNSTIGFNAAVPFITRDAKPEGMGRKYVLTLDFRQSF